MAYTVTISPGSFTFAIQPQESVLDAALHSGLSFPHSCREGNCGTCLGRVLGGEINYPTGLPLGLMDSDHQEGWALFCMAHAQSDLELDVREVSQSPVPDFYQTQVARVIEMQLLSDDLIRLSLIRTLEDDQPSTVSDALYLLVNGEQQRYVPVNTTVSTDTGRPALLLELHITRDESEFSRLVFGGLQTGALLRIAITAA